VPNYSFREHTLSEFTPRLTVAGPLGKRLSFHVRTVGRIPQVFRRGFAQGTKRAAADFSESHLQNALHVLRSYTLCRHHPDQPQEFRNAGLNREAPIETTKICLLTSTRSADRSPFLQCRHASGIDGAVSAEESDSRAKGTDIYRIWPNKRGGNFYLDEVATITGGGGTRISLSRSRRRLRHQGQGRPDVSFKYYDPRIRLRPSAFYPRQWKLACEKAATEVETFGPYSKREMGFFVQDTIQLRSDLSASYGFAWIRTGRNMSTVSLRESANMVPEHRIGHVSAAASVTSMIVFCFRH